MKLFALGLTLLASTTASAGWMKCSFTKGQVFERESDRVLARNFSPKIIRGARDLEIIQNGNLLMIYNSFGSYPHHVGYPNCLGPGDCFTVQTFESSVREYTITFDETRRNAIVQTYVSFGNRLEEYYVCR